MMHFSFILSVFLLSSSAGKNVKNGSVIIIGAGISGLGAADYLINEYNFTNVIILEALDRIGGRIYPVPFGNGTIQIGAQWVHGRNNSMFKLAKSLDALAMQSKDERFDGDDENFYNQNGCKIDQKTKEKLQKMNQEIEDEVEEMAKDESSLSVADLYTKVYDEYLKNEKGLTKNYFESMFDFMKKNFEAENAVGDWKNASTRQIYEYTPTVGGSDIPLGPNGYKPILDYFLSRIPKNNFHLNKTVKKITYRLENEPIIVETSDGKIFTADHVVVTSSLGYLKQNSKEMFDPPLPEAKLNTLMALGFDSVEKLFLIYDEPVWDSGDVASINFLRIANDSKICNTGVSPEIETNLSKIFFNLEAQPFFENVLLAFVRGDDTVLLEKSSNEEIKNAAGEVFQRFLKTDPKISAPSQIIRSSWRSEPTILGSYSYYSTECDRIHCDRKTLETPIYVSRRGVQIPAILFAGEATSEHEFQTANGGLSSGRREAKRVPVPCKYECCFYEIVELPDTMKAVKKARLHRSNH